MAEAETITARCIIDMLGAPKDYIEKTIHDFIQKLKEDYQILGENYAPAEENGTLFSTFCEIEVSFKDIEELFHFCLHAMPSSVEVLEPPTLTVPGRFFTRILNDLQSRLHTLDMELKRLKSMNEILDRNSLQTFRNFVQYTVREKPKQIGEISKLVGVEMEALKPFLDRMVEENYLLIEQGSYIAQNKSK